MNHPDQVGIIGDASAKQLLRRLERSQNGSARLAIQLARALASPASTPHNIRDGNSVHAVLGGTPMTQRVESEVDLEAERSENRSTSRSQSDGFADA